MWSVKKPASGNTYTNKKNRFTNIEPSGPPNAFHRLLEYPEINA
jgi:hypothetical protein